MNKLKRFISILLAILIMFTLIPSLNVQADNASGGGSSEVSGSASQGASQDKSGYRMYVVNSNGKLMSKVVDLVYKTHTADIYDNTTRIANGTVSLPADILLMPSDMPRPYIYNSSFVGNGIELKKWMRSKNSEGEQNIAALIYKYLGADILELFKDQSTEVFCVLEPITWHGIFTSTSSTSYSGTIFYGTFYNWMQLYNENDIGKTFTYQLDNNILGRCLTLEKDQPNLNLLQPTSGGVLDLNVVGSQGFGIHLYSNLDGLDTQTTCNEPEQSTPHKAPDESKGTATIVKNYRTKNENNYTDDGCYVKENVSNSITIEDEKEYSVIGWKTSTTTDKSIDSTKWELEVPATIKQSGSSAGKTVTLSTTEKTLYVLLEKQETNILEDLDADYKLGESQITKAISLKTTDKGKNILSDYDFKWNYSSLNNCGGHRVSAGKDSEGHTKYKTVHCDFSLSDTSWTFSIKNEKFTEFPKNIAATSLWSDFVDSPQSERRSSLGSGSIEEKYDYKMVLHRGSDSLTIAEWKNKNEALDSLDNFSTANSKSHTRKESDYKEDISLSFVDDSSDKTTSANGSEGCNNSDDASLKNPLSVDLRILYETYSGLRNAGKVNTAIDTSDMLTIGSAGNTIISGKMVQSGLEFSFHPYIQMRYDTLENKDNLVYVLGEYKRGMNCNDYAEIEWKKTRAENLVLSSLQWSTHAQAVNDKGVGNVIPGGATLSLTIPKSNQQEVTVRTYQCILIDDGREQVKATNGSIDGYTKETALSYHKKYVQSVIDGLEDLSVAQWQNKNDKSSPFDGIQVYNKADISSLSNGSKTASYEEKYYFKGNDDDSADEGDLDVKEGNTTTKYYTFSSDVCGNILMNGEVILTKAQGVESLSGTAKAINERTYVVTKLVDAIERNKGDDPGNTWTDSAWYNEAFDGITVAVNTTKLQTGFMNPYERTSVQDPKLNTPSYGQQYMFKDKKGNSSYMVAQFKMNDYSNTYGAINVIGLFKNSEVKMKDMDLLYYSKKYWVTNITTQDLH